VLERHAARHAQAMRPTTSTAPARQSEAASRHESAKPKERACGTPRHSCPPGLLVEQTSLDAATTHPMAASAPAMPPYVQAAIAAAKQEAIRAKPAAPAASPMPSGPASAPVQPPLVRLAVEAARSSKAAASAAAKAPSGTASSYGPLTSWEREADLIRRMHVAAGAWPPVCCSVLSRRAHVSSVLRAGARATPLTPERPQPTTVAVARPSDPTATAAAWMPASSPEPRLQDVRRIVTELDGLFAKA
jgi:hypothetical protein